MPTRAFRTACLVMAAAWLGLPPQSARSQAPATTPIAQAWLRPAVGVVEIAVAPDGSRVAILDREGGVRCFDSQGMLLWERSLPGAERLLCGPRGRLVLAYSPGRPLETRVRFLDAEGRFFQAIDTGAVIQDVCIGADGNRVLIGAGRQVWFCAMTTAGIRSRRVTTPAQVHQVEPGPGESAYVVTQSPLGLLMLRSSGRTMWRQENPQARQYAISATDAGDALAVATELRNDVVYLDIFDPAGFKRSLDQRPGRLPRIRLSAGGRALVMAYEHAMGDADRGLFGRRLLYTRPDDPRGGWTKGGAFSAPYFVALDTAGEWIVALDVQAPREPPRLRLYGRAGEKRYILPVGAEISIAVASRDGHTVALYRTDGMLQVFRVTLPAPPP